MNTGQILLSFTLVFKCMYQVQCMICRLAIFRMHMWKKSTTEESEWWRVFVWSVPCFRWPLCVSPKNCLHNCAQLCYSCKCCPHANLYWL